MGVETAFSKKALDETIILSNTFDEVGFGVVVVTTLKDAVHKVAMRVFPEILRSAGYDLCDNFYEAAGHEKDAMSSKKGFVLISEKGRP